MSIRKRFDPRRVRVNRRTLLRVAGAGTGAAILAGAGLGFACRSRPESTAQRMTWAFGDRSYARSIGAKYLADRPSEGSVTLLTSLIEARIPRQAVVTCPATAVSVTSRVARDDFVAGRTVWVDGWLLSATEARLCALATLSA